MVVICHYGITRGLDRTVASIRRNVAWPGAETHVHVYDQPQTQDPALLSPDMLDYEQPGHCLERWDFDRIASYGDGWQNDFRSLRNLVHQLHSLHRVTPDDADVVVFARPDLIYHDDLAPVIHKALSDPRPRVYVPQWQSFGGLNDRFAIAVGSAAQTYGRRIEAVHDFCAAHGPLHAERLLAFVLRNTEVIRIPHRASRVRPNGIVWESFSASEKANIRHEVMKRWLWTAADRSGVKALVKRVRRRAS